MNAILRRLAIGATLLVVAAVVALGALIGPFVYDDWKLDRTVRFVALDWRDFGEERARTRLQYELDLRGIGLQVGDSDCTFETLPAGRRVACSWGVVVDVPLTGLQIPLSFDSAAQVTPEGALR